MSADNDNISKPTNVIPLIKETAAPEKDTAEEAELMVEERYHLLMDHYKAILERMDRIISALRRQNEAE